MGTRAFAGWCGIVALAVVAGQHRLLFRAADALDVPELLVAVLTGATGLAWHEVAYAVGRGLGSPRAFVVVPYAGAAAGLAAAAGLLAGPRWLLRGLAVQVTFALGAGALALAVMLAGAARGSVDGWRIAALASFVAVQAAWAWYVVGRMRAPAPGRGGPSPRR